MGLLGISLLVASFVCFCFCPQPWLGLARPLLPWRKQSSNAAGDDDHDDKAAALATHPNVLPSDAAVETASATSAVKADRLMELKSFPSPPPPPPPPSLDPATNSDDDDEASTPKAMSAAATAQVPVFSLVTPDDPDSVDADSDTHDPRQFPVFPAPFSAQRASGPAPTPSLPLPPALATRAMPPPSRPLSVRATPTSDASTPQMPPPPRRLPTLPSTARSGSLLVPSRGPPSSLSLGQSSGLASTAPLSPSSTRARSKVMLAPGHSPLDWARVSADPNVNLRNLPSDAPPLLRVRPSLLKTMNGRRGRDAWTALGGMVYNISPYVPFHPGGAGELLRCAGKDGTRLFQDVHAWVNYDNMLAACRIGILVDESHTSSLAGPMEEMD